MSKEGSQSLYNALEDVPGAIVKAKHVRASKGQKKRTAVNKKNSPRLEERRAEEFGPQAQACRDIGICCCCGTEGPTDPHHLKTRGAGGKDRDTIPLARACHRRLHATGPLRFWQEAAIDPEDVRMGMEEWVAAGCPRGQAPVRKR